MPIAVGLNVNDKTEMLVQDFGQLARDTASSCSINREALNTVNIGLQGGPKMAQFFWYALTSSNINRFSKLFHFQNQAKMFNKTITKDPTTPQVCRYTTL